MAVTKDGVTSPFSVKPPAVSTLESEMVQPQSATWLNLASILLFIAASLPSAQNGTDLKAQYHSDHCCFKQQPGMQHNRSSLRLRGALQKAVQWAMHLDTHPVRLRQQRQMKGIKHMVR